MGSSTAFKEGSAADSRTVNYTYDPDNDLLTKVSQGTAANEYLYDSLNRLIGIKHNGFQYNFGYDAFGNRTTTKVGIRPLSENTYNPSNGKLVKSTYGNGAEVLFKYDRLNRVTENWWNGSKSFTWTYNNAGQVGRHEDLVNNEVYTYNYDTIGRLMDWRDSRGYGSSYAYDLNNNLRKWSYSAFGQTVTQSNTYGKDDLLKQSSAGGYVWTYSYDSLNRLTSKTPGLRTYRYSYVDAGDNKTTSLLSGLSVDGLVSYGYTYDAFGNIKTISENGTLKVTYTYDEWNQLIKEVHNGGDTIEYTYDRGGNRLSKKVNGTRTQQIMCENRTWRDAMTDFNGRSIGYDTIGNIVSYYNGSSYSFTWEKGRQLSTLQKGDTSVSYSYNADGLRTSKTVNGTKTSYVWDGSALLGQQGGGKTLIFLYDATGLYGFRYNGNTYFYLYNGQGDVVGILNNTGAQVVSYTYDAWGKPLTTTGSLASTIGELNPIRYRGYYYDAESGLYYLQSRYYDPVVGRFINADETVSTGQGLNGANMYAYCGNNPVNNSDPSGLYWIGNISNIRYDYLGCVTRSMMERYDGGLQNCTYYPDAPISTIPDQINPVTTKTLPLKDGREYGASRDNGKRTHKGIDFYVGKGTSYSGTPVYAITDGTVPENGYIKDFWAGTQALCVDNSDGTRFRYCEIKSDLRPGSPITKGQCIGYMIPNTANNGVMLHLEYYVKNSNGNWAVSDPTFAFYLPSEESWYMQ